MFPRQGSFSPFLKLHSSGREPEAVVPDHLLLALSGVLHHADMQVRQVPVPLLVLLNKSEKGGQSGDGSDSDGDASTQLTLETLALVLQIERGKMLGGENEFSLGGRRVRLLESSAKEGWGFVEGMQWLASCVVAE